MNSSKISLNKVGTLFNVPHFRYLSFHDPSRVELAMLYRTVNDGSNCLRRFLSREYDPTAPKDIKKSKIVPQVSVSWSFPPDFQNVIDKLSVENKTLFYKIFETKLRKRGEKKIFCIQPAADKQIKKFNFSHLKRIDDEYTCKILKHTSSVGFDLDINFALNLKDSKHHVYIFKAIGYYIYAGLPDEAIAKKFKFYPRQIKVLRQLFYDFSSSPRDSMARKAYFTQLLVNNSITEEDMRFYKLCAELGETGLKALADYHSLTPEEKTVVENYLGNSMLDNVLALNFSVTSMKDAINFNSVINNLASFYIKKEEVNYFRAKVKNLDACTSRIENDKSKTYTGLTPDDESALTLITNLALRENAPPGYKTINQLDN